MANPSTTYPDGMKAERMLSPNGTADPRRLRRRRGRARPGAFEVVCGPAPADSSDERFIWSLYVEFLLPFGRSLHVWLIEQGVECACHF